MEINPRYYCSASPNSEWPSEIEGSHFGLFGKHIDDASRVKCGRVSCEHYSSALCRQVVPLILVETSGTESNHSSRWSSWPAVGTRRADRLRGNIFRNGTTQSLNWVRVNQSSIIYLYYSTNKETEGD